MRGIFPQNSLPYDFKFCVEWAYSLWKLRGIFPQNSCFFNVWKLCGIFSKIRVFFNVWKLCGILWRLIRLFLFRKRAVCAERSTCRRLYFGSESCAECRASRGETASGEPTGVRFKFVIFFFLKKRKKTTATTFSDASALCAENAQHTRS